jgi:hypothetical protein
VNDVTELEPFISAARGDEVLGLGARPCSGRLDQADHPADASSVVRAAGVVPTTPSTASSQPWLWPAFSRCAVVLRPAAAFGRFCRMSSARQAKRADGRRRSHVNDVNPEQPRHVHRPAAHNRQCRDAPRRRLVRSPHRPRRVLLCRGCGSRPCACWQPDPRRLASAPGCRSRGEAATRVDTSLAAGRDESQHSRRRPAAAAATRLAASDATVVGIRVDGRTSPRHPGP